MFEGKLERWREVPKKNELKGPILRGDARGRVEYFDEAMVRDSEEG